MSLLKLSNSNSYSFVFLVFITTFILVAVMPPAILLFILLISLNNLFLAIRVSIISITVLITNQFILSKILTSFYNEKAVHVYIVAILFYFLVYGLIKYFSKIKLTKDIIIFIILTTIVFIFSYQNIFKSIQFLINIVGGFLTLFIFINSFLENINYNKIQKFIILEKDFFYLILTIIFFSFCIILIDINGNLAYLKIQAESLASFRGDGEIHLVNGIAKQYTTGFLGIDNIIRYASLINDPIRASYWYMYMFIFLIGFKFNQNIKLIILFILGSFLTIGFSKGAFISITLLVLFYSLFKYKLYKISILFFGLITSLFIYLSGILKSSAVIHVLGLLLPFEANKDIHYFLGNNFFQAGNMGRIPGEHWMDSVSRGAESLVGTYMYAYGILGLFFFFLIHYKTIILLNKHNIYILSSVITVGLFVTFLQEGQYNILQVYIIVLISFFIILRQKYKEKINGKIKK